MPGKKAILLIGLGWALLLGGVLMMLDACIRFGPGNVTAAGLESTAGFAVAVTGWLLRRAAIARAKGQ